MTVKNAMKKINRKYGKIAVMADEAVKPRYKKITKDDILNNDIAIIIDGKYTNRMSLDELDKMRDYKTFEIYQFSYKYNRWMEKKPVANTAMHEKGINKECVYYQIPIRMYGKSKSIPFHRLVYLWFNGEIEPYNENGELMDICHIDRDSSNNHITNLKWDTRKNNLAERTGAINQYGKRKHEML